MTNTASPTGRAQAWLDRFEAALAGGPADAVAALFEDDCYWRDLVAFTWNLRTEEGRDAVRAMVAARAADVKASGFRVDGEATEAGGVVEAWFHFETAVARGRGLLRLKGDLAWTLLTTMSELKGFEEKKGTRRIKGAEHGVHKGRQTWLEKRQQEQATLGYAEQPEVLIIGGGQGGIGLGARLRRLGVPTLIVEKNDRAGDSWRNRYKSLCLHDPVWYDHLPVPRPSRKNWPVFSPKDKIGDWLEILRQGHGADLLDLDDRGQAGDATTRRPRRAGTVVKSSAVASRDHAAAQAAGVLATGHVGLRPNLPSIPRRMERVPGRPAPLLANTLVAGRLPRQARPSCIGSNNSAHDICAEPSGRAVST